MKRYVTPCISPHILPLESSFMLMCWHVAASGGMWWHVAASGGVCVGYVPSPATPESLSEHHQVSLRRCLYWAVQDPPAAEAVSKKARPQEPEGPTVPAVPVSQPAAAAALLGLGDYSDSD